VRCVAARWPGAELDVLLYGRAPAETPSPPGTRRIVLPAPGPAAAPWFARLRRTGYAAAVLCHARLDVNRARGVLLAFTRAVAPAYALDPESGRFTRALRRRAVAVDAARTVAFMAGSRAAAEVLGALAGALARRPPPAARDVPAHGSVVYLRTDIDLALAPLTAGGSLAHTDGVLRALLRRGHAVSLWSTGELAGLPLASSRLPTVLRANVPWEMSELLSGLAQWRAVRPRATAFVYQRHSLNNLTGLVLARRWGVPLVLEANAAEAAWRRDWSVLRFPRLAHGTERLVLRRADRIAAVSENAAKTLIAAGADPARVVVVPNGVEVARFAGAAARPLPFPDDAFVVAFTGLFYPWHGVRHLAEAFVRLHAARPDARLVLVGDGEERALAEAILAPTGAALLTGMVARDDVPGYLAAADVLVSPHERNDDFIGSPIKLWEYMAAGRAIVASRVAQLAGVLRDGETALLVEPSDPAALAGALIRLHDDPDLRTRLGAAAGREAAERHSWDARLARALGAPR
jgi:glycosyltransferase involved in cell wall biosynthesis